jgi:hypothetical protein
MTTGGYPRDVQEGIATAAADKETASAPSAGADAAPE